MWMAPVWNQFLFVQRGQAYTLSLRLRPWQLYLAGQRVLQVTFSYYGLFDRELLISGWLPGLACVNLGSKFTCLVFICRMGEWSFGLFGCFDNCGLCVVTYFCPCIIFGRIAEKVSPIHSLRNLVQICNVFCGVSFVILQVCSVRELQCSVFKFSRGERALCSVFPFVVQVGESCCSCGCCIMMPIGNFISWLKIREKVREAKGIEVSYFGSVSFSGLTFKCSFRINWRWSFVLSVNIFYRFLTNSVMDAFKNVMYWICSETNI